MTISVKNNSDGIVTFTRHDLGLVFVLKPGESTDLNDVQVRNIRQFIPDFNIELVDTDELEKLQKERDAALAESKKAAEAKAKAEADEKKKADEAAAKKKADEEAAKKLAEDAAKKKADEEAANKAADEKAKLEAEAKAAAELAAKK